MTDIDIYRKTLSSFNFKKKKPFEVNLKDGRTAIVVWNGSEHPQNCGWIIKIYDGNGNQTFDNWPNVDDYIPKDKDMIEDWILDIESEEIQSRNFHKNMKSPYMIAREKFFKTRN